jgi:hypothetical protein
MKHFLNFKPTIVFRKGSSFMLKTSLIILYAAPLMLAFFWSFQYFNVSALNSFYTAAEQGLRGKTAELTAATAKKQGEVESLDILEKTYFDYRKTAAVSRVSWSRLLNLLEKITPPDLRFKSINIRPEKLVKVSLEGEARDLPCITAFMQALFNEPAFGNPDLKKHRRGKNSEQEIVLFSLEVDYLGDSGELP